MRSFFFEPFAPPDHPFTSCFSQMPRAFSLQVPPPENEPVNFKEGDLFAFGLTVWQNAESFLPYLVIAVQRTLESGIGKGLKANLERVVAENGGRGQVVFRSGEGILSAGLPSTSVDEILSTNLPHTNQLTVRFVTPVRIDIGGKLQNPMTYFSLVKSANERGRALFWAYEKTEPPWDGKELVRTAGKVETVKSNQQWLDLTRFSRRQGERLKIGGIVGWATFEGEGIEKFLPSLRLMEFAHVGKLTTMGLGQIAIEKS
ncbi:MAG: CRISPR system precrRNA processing endoribonuclease RAMP protein Cas6 [Candidatus Fervidibacter sp.]|uniref:CRISPR system precrRNA processing endoribonuclease RAMP protein Cas6 n=1 Tax=Candidatus Fervidibacter sp. TaxID=3100871 RepID=UPI00404A1FBF